MSSFGYFWYLACGVADFLAYFAFITGPLIFVAIITTGWAMARNGVSHVRVGLACIAPVVIPICVLTIGVAFERSGFTVWSNGTLSPLPWLNRWPDEYPLTALTALQWLHLPYAIALILWTGRGWPAVVGTSLWWAWVSLVASGMAGMSLTGDWL